MTKPPVTSRFLLAMLGGLAFLAVVATGGSATDAAPAIMPVPGAVTAPLLALQEQGAAVYEQRCAACHQPGGTGIPGIFPPLAGNARSADPAYVDDVIRNGLSGPIEVDGVPYDAVMSAVDLNDEDRAAVVDHVVGLATPAPGTDIDTTESAVAQPVTGDVDRGRRLFVGSTGFDNGGAACASCHQAGDVGHRGGSSLGPDLDASHANFGGEAGLAAWLAAPASPTMQPIFIDRPLTEPEIADLVAFLETAPDRPRPRSYGDGLLLGGLVGLGVLLGGMAAVRRTMNPSYSQRLRSRS